MEDELEKIAVTLEVLDLLDFSVLEVIARPLIRVLPQRVVHEKDLLLAEDHEFLVAFQLDQRDKVGSLTRELVQGLDHRF